MYTHKDIEFFKKLILDTIKPEKIILFGSYAYGIPTEKSDIDLLVIMPDEELPEMELISLGSQVGLKYIKMKKEKYIAHDICVVSKAEIEKLYNDKDSCIYDAMRKGIILYDRSNQKSSIV